MLKGKHLLEIGARFGPFVEFLNRHGASAQGIDINEKAVKLAKKHGVALIHGRAEDFKAKEIYEAVVSHRVLDCFYWRFFKPTELVDHIPPPAQTRRVVRSHQ